MSSAATILIAAVASLGSATAQPPARPAGPPAPPPVKADAATMQAANALVAQLGLKAQLQRQMAGTVAQMKRGNVIGAMLAQQPGFIPAYQANKAKFDPVLQKAGAIQAEIAQGVINQNVNAVVAAAAQAYARQYSAAELNGLIAFYKSPLGVKLQAKQALVGQEIAVQTARLIGAKIDAAMTANAPRLRAALAPLNSIAPPPAQK
ncbi:hypothetical protein CHU93_13925 [Sandarakinorhabdus cyanobacteriorum]|uniref:DUF2059 domain-containing protein n=1 Tax=Sandarakinorhabdus cyanobacteriorum TaxID=1981098 RepID=A0A255Y9N4_9SPHN|nr:DUF2059 domain-containing protein [Sandarakinorhabdus cyanobacteriorum]OYQ25345.1 hypothetical protein CHU93_13925 [Sandarakinorhabdus cyanobacteriorum]